MNTNTDPVRALIAKWRLRALSAGAIEGAMIRAYADELEAALASAPPSAPVGAGEWNPKLPPLIGTLAGLKDYVKPAVEAYGRACARAGRDAALAQQPAAPSGEAGQWVACCPALLTAGVSCARTPRRPGSDGRSHEHFIAHAAPQQPATVDDGLADEAIERALDAPLGLDHTLRQLIQGDTMPVGYSKVDVVRALLAALAQQPAASLQEQAAARDCTVVENGRLHRLEQREAVALACEASDLWYWQGDGADYPESLTCPVVMTADTLRELLMKAQQSAAPSGEAVAFVPVHPRIGPLWGDTYPAGSAADGRSPRCEHRPLFFAAPQQPAAVDEAPKGYYLASFKHKQAGAVLWWGPDNSGYTPDLAQAGIYTDLDPGYHDSEHTVPVPVEFVQRLRVRRVVDPGDQANTMFWTAESLRAALAAQQQGGA